MHITVQVSLAVDVDPRLHDLSIEQRGMICGAAVDYVRSALEHHEFDGTLGARSGLAGLVDLEVVDVDLV